MRQKSETIPPSTLWNVVFLLAIVVLCCAGQCSARIPSGGGGGGGGGGLVAAVNTVHKIQVIETPTNNQVKEVKEPQVITVRSNSLPMKLMFQTTSSRLQIDQVHERQPGTIKDLYTEDEPHRMVHHVRKPIIQEVHQTVQPFRKLYQHVRPVPSMMMNTVIQRSQAPFLPRKYPINPQLVDNMIPLYSMLNPHHIQRFPAIINHQNNNVPLYSIQNNFVRQQQQQVPRNDALFQRYQPMQPMHSNMMPFYYQPPTSSPSSSLSSVTAPPPQPNPNMIQQAIMFGPSADWLRFPAQIGSNVPFWLGPIPSSHR